MKTFIILFLIFLNIQAKEQNKSQKTDPLLILLSDKEKQEKQENKWKEKYYKDIKYVEYLKKEKNNSK